MGINKRFKCDKCRIWYYAVSKGPGTNNGKCPTCHPTEQKKSEGTKKR